MIVYFDPMKCFLVKNTLHYCKNLRYNKDLYSVRTTFATEEFGVIFDLEGNPSKKLTIVEENSISNFDESSSYSHIKFNSQKEKEGKKLSDKLKRDKKDIDNSFSNLNSIINTIDESLQTSSLSSSSNQQHLQSKQQTKSKNSESQSEQIQSSSQSQSKLKSEENFGFKSENRHNYDISSADMSGFIISYEKQKKKTGSDINTEIQNTIQKNILSKLNLRMRPLFVGIMAVAIITGGILWQHPNILANIFLIASGEATTAATATATAATSTVATATVNTINISPTLLYAGLSL